ncbi:uncharacterized protein LOC111904744 isoform X1 [Lactuca sativa]|uniref:uncharacterized protein LOC111904744 isoform X1 n=1 Tax=Lactuca sativa TaxID=4236 RepID=UPI000CD8A700|nr:uncharacterized protein LOC111904744 isoform X1 [Lactuca sativa]XP_023756240.1 uncharacterized protein LOC111904744 isoform X1 [Lactuca sativa]
MSEISRDMNTSDDSNIGPDLFQYYIRGVSELLSGDDFSPSSSRLVGTEANKSIASNEKTSPAGLGSLFSNAVGDGLSGVEKARLMSMLRQSVVTLTKEVDEMLGPVFSMHRLRALMGPTKTCARFQDSNCEVVTENHAPKRLKGTPNEQKGMGISDKSCQNKECAKFSETDNNTQKSNTNESKSLCGDCLKQANASHEYMNESFLGSTSRDDKENGEVNDDLQVLLVNRGPKVVEKMEKHSAELSAMLGCMEDKLEELLDVIISSCRHMTLLEKHKLRKLIEKLPPKNLDRVAEIIQRGKPSEKRSCDNIDVDLQQEMKKKRKIVRGGGNFVRGRDIDVGVRRCRCRWRPWRTW